MVDYISTLGLQTINANNLTSAQKLMSTLAQQLATGKKSSSLTDYTSSEAQKLMNFSNTLTQNKGFLAAINTVTPRISSYDTALTSLESVASDASSLATSSTTYNSEQNSATKEQIKGFMQQVGYYLNQKVGDRYIFAGSRYSEIPVKDLTTLPVPPTETSPYVTTGTAVPSYDTDYSATDPTASVPAAYAQDEVTIDVSQKLTYGVTSTQEGFQKLVMGLRWAYAATQDTTTDHTNYGTYMQQARDLISEGLVEIRGIHASISNASATLEESKDLHNTNITTLQSQIDDIQNVDINEVAVQINTFQVELEASYAATAKMTNLSILKYL